MVKLANSSTPVPPASSGAARFRWAQLVAVLAASVAAAQTGLAPAPGPDDPAVRTLIPLPPGWRVATDRAAGLPAQGLQIYVLDASAATPPVRAYCLAWDTTAPTVRFKPVLAAAARTPTQLTAQEPGFVYAAVNGGYFGGTQSFSLVLHRVGRARRRRPGRGAG